jgi:hypothetical protein
MISKINSNCFGLSSTLDEQMTADGARARDKVKGTARWDRRASDGARARLRWPNDEWRGTMASFGGKQGTAPATARVGDIERGCGGTARVIPA